MGLASLILHLRRSVEFQGVGPNKVLVRLCLDQTVFLNRFSIRFAVDWA
jgi:hypothetical protein